MKNKAKNSKAKGFGIGALLLASPMVIMYEGVVLQTYDDPVGIPTVCMGETDRELLSMRSHFNREECTLILGVSLQKHADEVAQCVHRPVKAHEAAAIVSWAYNVGTGAACKSTLLRKLNEGAPPAVWCGEFKRWVYAGGRVLRGLERRREAEYQMCMGTKTNYG